MGCRTISRAFEAAGGFGGTCQVCFGPSVKAPILVVLDLGQELPACSRCGLPVNRDGLTVSRPGGHGPKVLVIEGGEDALLASLP